MPIANGTTKDENNGTVIIWDEQRVSLRRIYSTNWNALG